jgi:alpha-L-fucosidase
VEGGGRAFRAQPPAPITDGDSETYWIARDADLPVEILLDLDSPVSFDRIVLREPIRLGQRISEFRVEAEVSTGTWVEIADGTTIGYKRILVTDPVTTSRVKLVIENALYRPALSELGLFFSGAEEIAGN